jgi:hypothetical protein
MIPFIGGMANNVVLSPALGAGLILFVHHNYTSNQSDFSLIFKGFSTNFGHVVLLNILVGLITILCLIPFGISFASAFDFSRLMGIVGNDDPRAIIEIVQMLLGSIGDILIGVFISTLGIIAVTTFYCLSNFFVVLGGVSAIDAMKASFGIVKRSFFKFLGFFIVLGLINALGILCLGIGVLVTMPITLVATYAMVYHLVISKVESDNVGNTFNQDVLDA